MNILIADASPIYRDILQKAMETLPGLIIEQVGTAADALLAAARTPFQFFILSGQLPDSDGFALAKKLRLSGHVLLEPIIVLTGSPTAAMNQEAEDANVTEIFRKSDIEELTIFLQRFLAVFGPLQGRALYVEDAEDQRLLLRTQLGYWGLKVDAFDTAETAWKAYLEADYDVVLTDLLLAGKMSGARLINRIRRLPGSKGDVPILALTAFDSPIRRAALFQLGVDDYVSKPIMELELRARVQHLLRSKGSNSLI